VLVDGDVVEVELEDPGAVLVVVVLVDDEGPGSRLGAVVVVVVDELG
jgi:hypothetical protein